MTNLQDKFKSEYFFEDTPAVDASEFEWGLYLLNLPEWKLLHLQGLKQCNQGECREVKPLTEFAKNKAKRDGYQDWCQACMEEWKRRREKHQKDEEVSLTSGQFMSFKEY